MSSDYYYEDPRTVKYKAALELIGNMVGAPTMQYADKDYQLEHLENRLQSISELVQEALR